MQPKSEKGPDDIGADYLLTLPASFFGRRRSSVLLSTHCFPEHASTAGFSEALLAPIKLIAAQSQLCIALRGLNPACTNLLPVFDTKSLAIKSKTRHVDAGVVAGFVTEDYEFSSTRTTSPISTQHHHTIRQDLARKATPIPLILTAERIDELLRHVVITEHAIDSSEQKSVDIRYITSTQQNTSDKLYEFILVKQPGEPKRYLVCYATPPAAEESLMLSSEKIGSATILSKPSWGDLKLVYYDDETQTISDAHKALGYQHIERYEAQGHQAVFVLSNPSKSHVKRCWQSAVTADIDIWGTFPLWCQVSKPPSDHEQTMARSQSKLLTGQGIAIEIFSFSLTVKPTAKLVRKDASTAISQAINQLTTAAHKHDKTSGDQDFDNCSCSVKKVATKINRAAGKKFIQHGDYNSYLEGELDFPILFALPIIGSQDPDHVEIIIVHNKPELTDVLSWLNTVFAISPHLNARFDTAVRDYSQHAPQPEWLSTITTTLNTNTQTLP